MTPSEKALVEIAHCFEDQIVGDGVWEHELIELSRNANSILDRISDILLDYREGWAFDAEVDK